MIQPRRAVRFVAFFALAAALAGCLDRRPPLPIVPEGQPLAFADERVARALERHATRARERPGLIGSARVALSGPDFKLNRPQRIALARPGRLRFEILGLFDQLAAILVTDGLDYGFFDASTGEVSRGRVSSALLWNLTKIDLAPDELVGLLLAAPRPADGTLRAGAWLEPSGRLAIAFAWPTGGAEAACVAEDPLDAFASASPECALSERAVVTTGGQLFFFDEREELVEVRGLDPGGVIRYRVHFDDYVVIEGPDEPRFPKRVTLESPASASEARFQWKRVRFVPELADDVFRLPAAMRGIEGEPFEPAPGPSARCSNAASISATPALASAGPGLTSRGMARGIARHDRTFPPRPAGEWLPGAESGRSPARRSAAEGTREVQGG